MKTTIDIQNELLVRAKRHARATNVLPDLRAGDPSAADPLERYSWPELRELIYGDPGTR